MWDKPSVLFGIANLFFVLAALLLLYAIFFQVLHLPTFSLREVKMHGELNHVTADQLKLVVGRHLSGNFFTLDLEKSRNEFQKLPWVRNVSVRRHWPDRLDVTLEEHHELARWGNVALVNTYGELFHASSDKKTPVFYGSADRVQEVAKNYKLYSEMLGLAGLRVSKMVLSRRQAWQITTDRGMVIELGREKVAERLQRFVNVYKQTLGSLSGQVRYADIRYPNGFSVRKPQAEQIQDNSNAS